MANSFQLWFRQKYNLAPTDPRYLAATLEDIEAEYWAYHYQENKATDEFEDDDFDLNAGIEEIQRQAESDARARAVELAAVDDWEDVEV